MARRAAPKLPAAAAETAKAAADLAERDVWIVGGAVRDAALGRPIQDLDLAATDAKGLARALAASMGGAFVVLDEKEGVYRVVLRQPKDQLKQVDVAELQGGTLEKDLARRDFTINAMALPAAGGELVDPRGGAEDCAKGVIRCEDEKLFKDDPLRLLRAFRIAAQLKFEIEKKTLGSISALRHRVKTPAGERVQAELLALCAERGCSEQLYAMERAGVLTALFEDLEPARTCAVEYYGEGGVLKHALDTAARADFLLGRLADAFPGEARALDEHLDARSGPGASHRALIVLAALLHDVSKPETARTVDGRLRFFGHDTAGAHRVSEILKRLRFSGAQVQSAHAAVLHHLRPGHLAAGGPITEKAVYRFFRDLGEEAATLLCVCWADHASYLPAEKVEKSLKIASAPVDSPELSKIKPADARKTIRHLQIVAMLMRRLFAETKPVPERLLDGREVMKLLKLKPGPAVGEALERLREAQATGAVRTREEALSFLRRKTQ